MIAVSLIGYKNSGKTTLGVSLARELKARGRSVSVVKHAGHFTEPEGADTAQYKAVADMVVGISEGETLVSWPKERPLLELLPLIKTDVLLVEGGKKLGYLPRIVILGEKDGELEAEELSRGLALAVVRKGTADPAALAGLILDKGFLLPGLSCGACERKGCTQLTREIVAGTASFEECVVTGGGTVTIKVDGAELAVNPFVARFMASGLRGMLSELKGFSPGTIEITLE
ncbi:MAG: molybdopterin-guanine dinucleotide biosynthesis protein MobB [Proteobacteria bacterium]|nr:molybdopterin-guanine dinucleotide biosynthesis protein MobB [Pseudomonadota bacterium]MBU1610973.1 molybdopterin-guanine dinucleotide biosynthesis protein MobB [Pseudomonadota bacterium]